MWASTASPMTSHPPSHLGRVDLSRFNTENSRGSLSGAVILVLVGGLGRGRGGDGSLGLGRAVILILVGSLGRGGNGGGGGGGSGSLGGAVVLVLVGSLGRGGNGGSGGGSSGGLGGAVVLVLILGLDSVEGDTGVGALVGAGEGNQIRGARAAGAGNLDLVAAGVELSAGVGVGGVEGDDLVADEVLAGGNALGDGVLDTRVASLHERGGTPVVGGALAALLLNLEPDSVGARLPRGAVVAGALGHVGDGRADVGLGPEGPVKGDLLAGGSLSNELGGLGALNTTGGVATALKVDAGDVLDGAVALDGTRDAVGGGVHVRVLVGLVERVVLTADQTIVDDTVSSHQGCGSKKGGDSGLHFVGWRGLRGFWLVGEWFEKRCRRLDCENIVVGLGNE
ncbi:hypothetical protein ColTof4_14279 [Colletotrichum tofieldiae]|nr:hypothetical protein ColTof3_00032 [Colletotrichum tofieldiae]GKT81855.1 hypothetical protein ColTof4_14279 [Colletotrichum tofieldiae]